MGWVDLTDVTGVYGASGSWLFRELQLSKFCDPSMLLTGRSVIFNRVVAELETMLMANRAQKQPIIFILTGGGIS